MDKGSKKISVRIGGMSYNLVSGESEEYTRQIAARADEMIRRVTMTSPQLSQQMTTILALVNAVDDLTRQSGQLALAEQQREAAETKSAEMRAELAKLRELNWEMKKELLRLSGLLHEQERQAAQRMEPIARPKSTPTAALPAEPAVVVASVQAATAPMPVQSTVDAASPALHEQVAIPFAPIAVPFAPEAPLAAAPVAAWSASPIAAPMASPVAPEAPVAAAPSPDVTPAAMAAWPAFEPASEPAFEPASEPASEPALEPASEPAMEASSVETTAASPAPAASARILPPLGFGRSRDARPKALDPSGGQPFVSPLKNLRANPWAEPADPEAAPAGSQDDTGGSVDQAHPATGASHHGPAAGTPRQINQLRQTGLEEYLSRYGQGRSTVQDLRPEDEP